MSYPSVAFKHTSPLAGMQPIGETSTTQKHPFGTVVRAADITYGEGEFIYLAGAASTAAGDVVCFNGATGATVRAVHAGATSKGPMAVAMSANLASQYGWYQIRGSGPIKTGTVLANGTPYLTTTAGQIDDAVVSGDMIDGLLIKAADSGGFATCQLANPSVAGDSGLAPLSYTDGSGTTGSQTISKLTGKCAIAAGAKALTITNTLVTAASLIQAWEQQAAPDATLGELSTNAGSGSFTITGQANATADTVIAFLVLS